jgi:hypothetical protein
MLKISNKTKKKHTLSTEGKTVKIKFQIYWVKISDNTKYPKDNAKFLKPSQFNKFSLERSKINNSLQRQQIKIQILSFITNPWKREMKISKISKRKFTMILIQNNTMIYQGAIKKASVYLDIKDLNTNMTWMIERIDKMIISAKSQVKKIFLSQRNK